MNAAQRPIDIAVVDKNPLIIRGLRDLFAESGRISVMASAPDGERLLDALDRLDLDVVVSGWVMPYCSGRELLERLQSRKNAPRVIIYTGDTHPEVPRMAMHLGAAGFYAKSDPPENLAHVIEAVARGSMIFPFMALGRVEPCPLDLLTARENELLTMLTQGLTNQEIASALGVSLNTVKFHLRNLYDKLNVRNRAEAVALRLSPGAFQPIA